MWLDAKSRNQLLLTLGLAILVALIIPRVLFFVTLLGHNIPSLLTTDKTADYLKGWATALLFMALIVVAPIDSEDKKNLKLVWLAKIVVTLVFMLFYEANYGLDAYSYFERSQDRFPDFSEVGFTNGTANMIAFTWIFEHYVISTASFHAQKVICAFIGCMGIFLFYRALRRLRPEIPHRAFPGLALFPSVLFWSSTLGKDAMIVFGISLTLYGMLRTLAGRNPLFLLISVFGLVLTAMIRIWLAPILVLSFCVVAVVSSRNIVFRLALLAAVLGGATYAVPRIGKQLSVEDADQLAARAGAISRSWQRGGSAGDVPIIRTPTDDLKFLPVGMFTALFRPLPGEVMNPFGMLAGFENLVLLYLVWHAARAWRRETWKDELVAWFFAYVLLWGFIYAFISPQNLGAAVRFKVQVLPELLVLLAYVAYFKPRASQSSTEAQ